jgi:hypothetical protein
VCGHFDFARLQAAVKSPNTPDPKGVGSRLENRDPFSGEGWAVDPERF